MFNLEQAITEWRRWMLAAGIKSPEALNELESHLRDDVEQQIRSGLGVEQAFDCAVLRLGKADTLKGEFAKTARVKRRQYLYRGLGFGIGLFILGMVLSCLVLIPVSLAASRAYSHWLGFSPAHWQPGEYMIFVCKFILGMGLVIEMPVVILTLVKIGVLNYRLLSKARTYVILVNLILGAVLTAPEVATQLMMFVPLQVLYEASVWTAWYWERQDKQLATPVGTNQL